MRRSWLYHSISSTITRIFSTVMKTLESIPETADIPVIIEEMVTIIHMTNRKLYGQHSIHFVLNCAFKNVLAENYVIIFLRVMIRSSRHDPQFLYLKKTVCFIIKSTVVRVRFVHGLHVEGKQHGEKALGRNGHSWPQHNKSYLQIGIRS